MRLKRCHRLWLHHLSRTSRVSRHAGPARQLQIPHPHGTGDRFGLGPHGKGAPRAAEAPRMVADQDGAVWLALLGASVVLEARAEGIFGSTLSRTVAFGLL